MITALRDWNDELFHATQRLGARLAAVAVTERSEDKPLSPEARREKLCRWRREEARRRGVAPYFVLTNGTVEKLSTMEVLGREDLRRVPGIGPRKLDAYGDAILRVLGA